MSTKLVDDLGWCDGVHVWVVRRNLRTTTVTVQLLATSTKYTHISLVTRPAHTVADLEHAVASALKLPPDSFRGPLWYGDVQLKRSDRLGVYRLPDNAVLRDWRNTTLRIEVRCAARYTIILSRACWLLSLRQEVERLTGVPAADQVVVWGTRTLNDSTRLVDQGVVEGTSVQLLTKAMLGARCQRQNIKTVTLTGKIIHVDILMSYDVLTVKQCIEDKEGIPPCCQRLIFAGKHMEDDRALSYYRPDDDDILLAPVHGGPVLRKEFVLVRRQ